MSTDSGSPTSPATVADAAIAPYPSMNSPYDPMAYPEPPKKSSTLGIIGLALVIVLGILLFIAVLSMYKAAFTSGLMAIDPYTYEVISDMNSATDAQMSAIMGPAMLILLIGIAGLSGFIISIVATATGRGRAFGIVGIVLGVIAPIVAFIAAATVAVTQYLPI
ncbi:MAG: hypothetical protein FWG15_04545 [Propionibacteriaceae bacterium]|nr:hypothetical protein [Propionibacteriaceae bacterium]